jgi:hypothetical protein
LRTELRRYATEQAQVDLKRAYADLQETLQLKAAAPTTKSAWGSVTASTKLLIIAAVGGSAALGVNALRSAEPAQQMHAIVSQTPSVRLAPPPPEVAQPEAAPPVQVAASIRTPSTSSGSRREIAQLVRIKALLEHDPAAARRLIRAAQREFPAGLLVEEREGLDVIALFALGQHERARTSAERFIARYPQSALRSKLQRLIADARE